MKRRSNGCYKVLKTNDVSKSCKGIQWLTKQRAGKGIQWSSSEVNNSEDRKQLKVGGKKSNKKQRICCGLVHFPPNFQTVVQYFVLYFHPRTPQSTLRTPWWNCYRTATASELLWSRRNVTGGAFQTDTSLANHRHRTRLLADCQWRCRWRCGLGRLRNTRSLTEAIPRDRRKLIKLMLRKWTFLPPRSHLIRQFVKRHLVTLRREQHVLAQWLRQYFCQDHGVRSVSTVPLTLLV